MLTIVHAGVLAAAVLSFHPRESAGQAARASEASAARVRPLDPLARVLIRDGAARSPLFAGLLAKLDRGSRLVVYVTTRATELSTKGALRFVSRDQWFTYVMVCVDPKQGQDDRIAVLAHELRHATEIAPAAADVSSQDDLRLLYRRIGFDCGRGVESDAARATQNAVRRELAPATTTPRASRAGG